MSVALLVATGAVAVATVAMAQQRASTETLPKLEEVWIAAKARCAARANAGDAWAKKNPMQCAIDTKDQFVREIEARIDANIQASDAVIARARAEAEAAKAAAARARQQQAALGTTQECIARVLAIARTDPATYAKAVEEAGVAGQPIDESNVCKIDQKLIGQQDDATRPPATGQGGVGANKPAAR